MKLIWVAYDMFREYYISAADGSVYVAESVGPNTSFKPKSCDNIPDGAEYITYPIG